MKHTTHNTKHIKHNNGFTLIETMVAVVILSLALTALLGLISSSLFYARYSRNEITANYLLQEVIDFTKNKRSSSLLDSTIGWDGFVNNYNSCVGSDGCEIDVQEGSIKACNSSGCRALSYDEREDNLSFYNYEPGLPVSNFKRKVVVTSDADQLNITVTVTWMNGKTEKSRSLSSSLLNWQ